MSDLFQIEPNGNVILTHSLIEAGMSAAGGWNRKQLDLLGVAWPPLRGWKWRLAGTQIEAGKYRDFLRLKGMSPNQKKQERRRENEACQAELAIHSLIEIPPGDLDVVPHFCAGLSAEPKRETAKPTGAAIGSRGVACDP